MKHPHPSIPPGCPHARLLCCHTVAAIVACLLCCHTVAAIVACLLCCHTVAALPPGGDLPLSPHYAGVKHSDPWLCTLNAAALTRYDSPSMGMAQLSLTKGEGGFTDFWQSPDALTVDATVEALFRLSGRAVVYGSMAYTNFSGHDMAGSAFIRSVPSRPASSEPSAWQLSRHLPFDIVEDSLTNAGTKHQDTYRMAGAFGYDLGRGLAVGARLDYTAANMAKYKDLRHKNKLMDLNLTTGFYLPVDIGRQTRLGVGANYLYHRTTEGLQFSTYGKGDKVYNSLISYANFTGPVEQFGSMGYTDKSREMPLVSNYNGLGLQFSLLQRPSSQAASPQPSVLPFPFPQANSFFFYSAFTYARRGGYYGRRSPYTITYTGHTSDLYHYDARLTATTRASRFSIGLSLDAENLRNDAATYRELQNEQGATYYEYYTPVKAANKLWTDGSLALTADLGHVSPRSAAGLLPAWTVRAGLNWHHREQTAYLYPYYRRQDISSREPFVCLCRNIVTPLRHKRTTDAPQPAATARNTGSGGDSPCWTLALHFSFLKGKGLPYEDLTYQQPSDKQSLPPSMDTYLWREYQWLTSAQYQVGGAVACSFIMPGTRLRTCARLAVSHRKANETDGHTLGRDHTTASFSIGCQF